MAAGMARVGIGTHTGTSIRLCRRTASCTAHLVGDYTPLVLGLVTREDLPMAWDWDMPGVLPMVEGSGIVDSATGIWEGMDTKWAVQFIPYPFRRR